MVICLEAENAVYVASSISSSEVYINGTQSVKFVLYMESTSSIYIPVCEINDLIF